MMKFHCAVLTGETPKITSYSTEGGYLKDKEKDAGTPNVFWLAAEDDCAGMSIPQLLTCINFLRKGKAIKSLHDRSAGAKRLWLLLTTRTDESLEESSADTNKGVASPDAPVYEGGTPPGTPEGDTTEEEADMAGKKAVKKSKDTKKASKSTKAVSDKSTKTAEVIRLLKRANGATRADILEATGWKAVSVQQQAKAAGMKLRQEKEKGSVTRYYLS